ncbi:hypothetical protein R1sor_022076 [Riccia sorocarpa]|uniref:Elongation factor P C-terminal domain-containing protein n=1 Tax=Riccia sorocarpa TaxID=122646 RepID=A0ABD3GM58_9MARC
MRGAQQKQQAILLRLFARAVIADALPSSAAADCLVSTCTLARATSSRPVPSLFSRLLWTQSGPGCALPRSVLGPQAFDFELKDLFVVARPDGMEVKVQYFDGKPLSATVPDRVTCTVTEAEPYFKGQTATPQYKRIVLDNGLQIMAPSFVVAGDKVVVDTAEHLYIKRYVFTSFLQFTLPVKSKHVVPSEWNFVSRS